MRTHFWQSDSSIHGKMPYIKGIKHIHQRPQKALNIFMGGVSLSDCQVTSKEKLDLQDMSL